MLSSEEHIIYTIGHSTHNIDEFLKILGYFNIRYLIDIRSFPGSRKFPHFNKENLEATLKENGIDYTHLKDLGGRRKAQKNSKNIRWRNDSFRAYADYMETENFKKGIAQLEAIASKQITAYMCSEAVWWRCHRSMVSDYLKAKGWKVLHIIAQGKAEEHTYTSPARVTGNQVFYSDENLFSESI